MEIGIMTTVQELLENPLVKEYPALYKCIKELNLSIDIATLIDRPRDIQGEEIIPVLLIYDAELKSDIDSVKLANYLVDPAQLDLTSIREKLSLTIPEPAEELKSFFLEDDKNGDIERVICCAVSYIEDEGSISELKLALGGIGAMPLLLEADWFGGKDEHNINRLQRKLDKIASKINLDWYRRDRIKILAQSAILRAVSYN